jgi:hypothetical protein
LLAAHPQVISLWETSFFHTLEPIRPPYKPLGWLGMTSSRAPRVLWQVADHFGLPEPVIPKWHLQRRRIIATHFVDLLDNAARSVGGSAWVEKTPTHLQRISLIERYVPGAKFVHIVRDGTEVVASLHRVAQDYGGNWSKYAHVEECVTIWNTSVRLTLAHAHKPNHYIVRYESLIENTEEHVRRLCGYLGISFDESMLSDYRTASQKLYSAKGEPWKGGVTEAIASKPRSRFEATFDKEVREHIEQRTRPATEALHRVLGTSADVNAATALCGGLS